MTKVYFPIILSLLLLPNNELVGQNSTPWQNKKCAVVLTYDDALSVHLDNVIPLLDSLGLKATFYLPISFQSFRTRSNEWIEVAKRGHELGNHTLFHPCEGKAKGREWVDPTYDLNSYTLKKIEDEITIANTMLGIMDCKTKRTFAYTCGDMKVGDTSFVDLIKQSFVAARGVESKMGTLKETDLYNIGSYMIMNKTGEQLIALVQEAMKTNSLIVFLFHGVGGEHNINVSLEAHRALLEFLKQNEKDIWVAPMVEVAEYIKENQKF